MLNLLWCSHKVRLSPDTCILLNMDLTNIQHNDTIDIHYLDPDGTNFSFVTHISIPHLMEEIHIRIDSPSLAFSANGSKFAMGTARSGVSVWDIRNKVPLRRFTSELTKANNLPPRPLQFSSGNLGKEILVFVEVRLMFTFQYPYLSNRWSESLARS